MRPYYGIKELRDAGHLISDAQRVAGGTYRYVYGEPATGQTTPPPEGPSAPVVASARFVPPPGMPVYRTTPKARTRPAEAEQRGLF